MYSIHEIKIGRTTDLLPEEEYYIVDVSKMEGGIKLAVSLSQ